MTSPYRIERDRGIKDSSKQLLVLREKWPLAFPLKLDDVRPLAAGASREIAAAMGWSLPYTLGVLGIWKLAAFYCRAILAHDQRITLDGAPAETVDAEAKDLATKRLAELTARKAPKKPATGPKACRDDRRAGTKGSRDRSRACLGEAAGEAQTRRGKSEAEKSCGGRKARSEAKACAAESSAARGREACLRATSRTVARNA